MHIVHKQNNKFVLRFEPGEELMGALKQFCTQQDITAGHFAGIGASAETTLAFFELTHKRYRAENFKEEMEIASLSGNISLLLGEVVIHAHGNFADRFFNGHGGHVMSLKVSATCEVILEVLDGVIERGPSEETGLNLLK